MRNLANKPQIQSYKMVPGLRLEIFCKFFRYFFLSPRYPHIVNTAGKKCGTILTKRDAYNDRSMPPASIATMTNRELWQNALVQIELGTTEASFRTWFRNTDIASRDG